MDKRQILKDSVTRLLALNISDKEILENLASVGIDREMAKSVLEQTKDELSGKKSAKPQEPIGPAAKPSFLQSKPKEQQKKETKKPQEKEEVIIPDDEDIYSKLSDEEVDELYTPVKEKPIANPDYSSVHNDETISRLWEKGILSTVDAKLSEMQKIRSDLDSMLDAKIAEKIKLESKKIETVLESQRALFYSKIDAHLEAKAEEIKKVVESRAHQIEDLHEKLQSEIIKLQGEKKFNAELLNSLNEKMSGLDMVKSQMISETNKSIIDTESKIKEFLDSAQQMRSQTDERVNRSLQLEAKITEGMMQDVKQKIESLRLSREDELTAQIQGKLKELDRLTDEVDPKGIIERVAKMKELEQQLTKKQKQMDLDFASKMGEADAIIVKKKEAVKDYTGELFDDFKKEFADFKKEVSKIEATNLEELRKEYSTDVDALFAKNLIEWEKKLKEKKKEIDELESKIDVEKFDATLESFEVFKQQFLNTIKRSIEDYNKSKKELSDSIIARDKAISEYLKKIDAKMQELSEFQKKFSADVADLIGKIPEDKIKARRKGP
ncbi:MAG TPA: hypothetical protein VJG83_02755 [archaeon]|nr:hypothetical protein [archaeon]